MEVKAVVPVVAWVCFLQPWVGGEEEILADCLAVALHTNTRPI